MTTTTAAAVKPGDTVRFTNIGSNRRCAIRVEKIKPSLTGAPRVTLIGYKARVKDGVQLGWVFKAHYIRLDTPVEVF